MPCVGLPVSRLDIVEERLSIICFLRSSTFSSGLSEIYKLSFEYFAKIHREQINLMMQNADNWEKFINGRYVQALFFVFLCEYDMRLFCWIFRKFAAVWCSWRRPAYYEERRNSLLAGKAFHYRKGTFLTINWNNSCLHGHDLYMLTELLFYVAEIHRTVR